MNSSDLRVIHGDKTNFSNHISYLPFLVLLLLNTFHPNICQWNKCIIIMLVFAVDRYTLMALIWGRHSDFLTCEILMGKQYINGLHILISTSDEGHSYFMIFFHSTHQ